MYNNTNTVSGKRKTTNKFLIRTTGLYNATKTIAFARFFAKCE
jgi:hypothetical protein